ncbi:MAG: PTS sugar transporter subunit IIA [Verrucomicrobia bacterium]|nr:PTS sugar transporter subunit IIA [Verrucomicrobiota bacterium]
MDLELQEVAQLLNVSDAQILKLTADGKLPSYNINGSYRFNRQEIEAWVIGHKQLPEGHTQEDDHENHQRNGLLRYNLFRALNNGEVLADIEASNKEAVIRTTMKKIAPSLRLDAEVLTEIFMDRENVVPTAVGNGFAIPHARDFLIEGHRDMVTVVYLAEPIAYGALDGLDVHTLFFLMASDDRKHLALLSKIAHLMSTPSMVQTLKRRPQKQELLDIVKAWETTLL